MGEYRDKAEYIRRNRVARDLKKVKRLRARGGRKDRREFRLIQKARRKGIARSFTGASVFWNGKP